MPGLKQRAVTIETEEISVTKTHDSGRISYARRRLYSFEELPNWQKDNEHILHGYVRETGNLKDSLKSLFYLHNESVNIYTHLLPALLFLAFTFATEFYMKKFPTTNTADYFYISLFFLGAFTCLILSSIFHCVKCHSLPVATFGNKLDYLGIVALISTSMISILYYGFYDSKYLFYSFSGLTSFFGFLCAYMSLKDKFRAREWRPYRALVFVIFGLSAIFPIMTGLFYFGLNEIALRVSLKWVVLEGVLYIFGAFLYGIRFPERLAPGRFDIWGHSHQLFHVLVVIAALSHLRALLDAYELVHERLGY